MQSGLFKKYDPLEKWGSYTPEEVANLSPEELELYFIAKSPDVNVIFLKDEHGNDWYQWLKSLSKETLKISFNPDSKEINHFSYDASTIFPINQIVVEVASENVPYEFTAAGEKALGGTFIFDEGKIAPVPVDYKELAESRRQSLLDAASETIEDWRTELQLAMISDDDKASLIKWMTYIKALKALDFTSVNDEAAYKAVKWPLKPTQ